VKWPASAITCLCTFRQVLLVRPLWFQHSEVNYDMDFIVYKHLEFECVFIWRGR
jgi:hypothetical protein